MAGGYQFAPLNVRAVYQNDGSAKSSFLAEVERMTNDAGKMFKDFSNEARTQLDAALAVKRNNAGSLDLGVEELRSAAAAQQARAVAAREVAAATALAAQEEGDYSQKARLAVAATQALAIEEERAAAQARAHAQAAEQVQERLNRQASATDLVVAATKRGTSESSNVINGIRAQRVAFTQLGQQLQDVVVQTQMGTNATTIFVQQVPQMAFALSGLTESTNKFYRGIGKVGTFLAGPWGAAIFAATAVLGPYIAELFRATDALDEVGKAAQDAMQKLQQSVANASNFTDAISKSQTSLVTAMGKVGRAQQGILETQKAINALQGRAGSSQTVTALSNRLTQLQLEKAAAQKELDTAKADLANIRGLADTVRIQEANRKALNPDKPKKERKDRSAERASRAAMVLGEFGEDAAKRILNIRDSFADIPPEVERVNKASRELDDIISDLNNRKPEGFEAMVAQAEALKKALPDLAVQQAMEQITREAQQQVQYQMLILQGREGEAQALQIIAQKEAQYGNLTRERKEQIIATGIAMQRINEEMQRASEIQAVFLDATRNVRGEVEAILGGYGKLGDLGATLRRSFQNIQGKILTERIFGDVFRDMDRYVKEKTGIGSSVDMMAKETERAGEAATDFANTLINATRTISGGGTPAGGVVVGASAASAWGNMRIPDSIRLPGYDLDPNGPLVVAGIAKADTKRDITDLTPEEFFHQMGQKVGERWAKLLEPLLGKKLAGNLGGVIGGVFEGQAATGTGFGAILGGLKELKGLPKGVTEALGGAFKGAQTGAKIAGLGNALGIKMSNTGAQIGGALGSFAGPVGGIIGSVAGGLLGSLFGKKVTSGYAQVRNGSVVGTYGRTGSLQNDAAEAAGGLVDTIASLAKTLGTTLGNYDFDFGKKNDKYVVNTGVRGVFNFDSEQEAMEFAVREAVADGAFIGIKDAQKRLIMASGDLEAQVEKAVKFGDVFKQLKAIKDPVGAALDDLNTEFSGLIDIFKEAGASASEYADLEELYGLKRADAIKQANETILASMKGLQASLTIGSDYLSLRDRKSAALEVFNPLAERVKAGDTTAFNDYVDAANSLLDIERQISGSTSAFFDVFNQIKGITDNAIAGQNNITSIATASDSPFTALASQQQATASAIDNQTTALIEALGGRLDTLNDNLINAIRSMVASGDTSNISALLTSNGYW